MVKFPGAHGMMVGSRLGWIGRWWRRTTITSMMSDVTLRQVIAIVGHSSQVTVLRTVPLQKTVADKNTVTTWSPFDLADVNGDGQIEVILEGDAYADHWIEVFGIKGGFFKTISRRWILFVDSNCR